MWNVECELIWNRTVCPGLTWFLCKFRSFSQNIKEFPTALVWHISSVSIGQTEVNIWTKINLGLKK